MARKHKPQVRTDIYKSITDEIVAQLEAGNVRPWHRPWSPLAGKARKSKFDFTNVGLPLRATGGVYRGINVIILWASAARNGFAGSYWMTFNKANELGGQVRKGSVGTKVIYYKVFTEEDEDGNEDEIPLMRAYTVFNTDQIDGLPERFYAVESPKPKLVKANVHEPVPTLEVFFASLGAKVTHGGERALYNTKTDTIRLPVVEAFTTINHYYGTRAHETVHWTGHKKRLDRNIKNLFGSATYAFEELIAELGAAFVCATLGLVPDMELAASYIEGWIEGLKKDKKAIFRAASAAQKAADYLHNLSQPALKQAA